MLQPRSMVYVNSNTMSQPTVVIGVTDCGGLHWKTGTNGKGYLCKKDRLGNPRP